MPNFVTFFEFTFSMDEDEFYYQLDSASDCISWENTPIPDLWVPTRRDDSPILLVTYDRIGGRRILFRPFGKCTDADFTVRLLRLVDPSLVGSDPVPGQN